jgi:hypothetical protein
MNDQHADQRKWRECPGQQASTRALRPGLRHRRNIARCGPTKSHAPFRRACPKICRRGAVHLVTSQPIAGGKYVPAIRFSKLITRHRPKSRCNHRWGMRAISRRSSYSQRRQPSACTIEQQNVDLPRRIVRPPWHPERGVMVFTAARALEAPKPSPRALPMCRCYRNAGWARSASGSRPLRMRRKPRD